MNRASKGSSLPEQQSLFRKDLTSINKQQSAALGRGYATKQEKQTQGAEISRMTSMYDLQTKSVNLLARALKGYTKDLGIASKAGDANKEAQLLQILKSKTKEYQTLTGATKALGAE